MAIPYYVYHHHHQPDGKLMSLTEYIDAELERLRLQREQYLILHYKADGAIQALEMIRQREAPANGIPMSDFVKMVGGENATGSVERVS